jgi:hypothetical protein
VSRLEQANARLVEATGLYREFNAHHLRALDQHSPAALREASRDHMEAIAASVRRTA